MIEPTKEDLINALLASYAYQKAYEAMVHGSCRGVGRNEAERDLKTKEEEMKRTRGIIGL